MFAPRVYISMIGALCVFAIVTFILTGSAWTTLWQTLACALLLQVGYFLAVFALVMRTDRERRKVTPASASTIIGDDKESTVIRVPNNTRHFNS